MPIQSTSFIFDIAQPVTLQAAPASAPHTLTIPDAGADSYAIVTPDIPVRGNLLYNNGTTWKTLAPGTSGFYLKAMGANADPVWVQPALASLSDIVLTPDAATSGKPVSPAIQSSIIAPGASQTLATNLVYDWALTGSGNETDLVASATLTNSGSTQTTGGGANYSPARTFAPNQYMECTSTASLNFSKTQAWSLLLRFNMNSTAPNGYICGKISGAMGWAINSNGTGGAFNFVWYDSLGYMVALGTVTTNAWHTVVLTHDGTGKVAGLKFYLDGVLTALTNNTDNYGTGTMNYTGINFRLGYQGGLAYTGSIAHFAAWTRQLQSVECTYLTTSAWALEGSPAGFATNDLLQYNGTKWINYNAQAIDVAASPTFNALTLNATSAHIRLNTSGAYDALITAASTATADRTYTIPDCGANANFVMTAGAQSGIAGLKTFTGGVTLTTANLTLTAVNLATDTSTGMKIGTATGQKIAFWNKTPIVQPTTGITGAAFVAGSGTAVNDASTFGGYTIKQIAAALVNTGLLA